jgi:hypothetical protein
VTNDRSRAWLFASLLALPMLAHGAAAEKTEPAESKWSKTFHVYGSTAVDGGECVAGDATKEGMDGRAYVYLKDSKTRQPRWMTAIPLADADMYQNRATHCFTMGGSLFVLVQTDTNQATSLSQTLLSVTELSPLTGKIISSQDADIPGIDDAYSAWVDKGSKGFHEEGGQIRIAGQYFLMENSEKRMPFTFTVAAHPAKKP